MPSPAQGHDETTDAEHRVPASHSSAPMAASDDATQPDSSPQEARASSAQKPKVDGKDARKPARAMTRSLSHRSRGEGWDIPEGGLKKYRSRWRSAVRRILQRGLFRPFLDHNITSSTVIARRVKSVRGPFVLVANHTSHLDGPLLATSLPWPQARLLSTGAAADYFFNTWYKRAFVRLMLNAFPIDRDASRKHAGMSRKLLQSGVPILVFPEGGRQKSGRMGAFKPGAAALAQGVGVPVIPAAIVGGYEAMPKGRSWPKKGKPPVRVVFGDPLVSRDGEDALAYTARIREAVHSLYLSHYDDVLGSSGTDEQENAA